MTMTVRRLGVPDAAASQRLEWEAFGPADAATTPTAAPPGVHGFGGFDGSVLAAQVTDREFDLWFGGRVVPVAGIANVTVAAEHRGRGALGPVLTATLRAARERGAVLSTLFPSAPRIYRRFGYEVITSLRRVDVPSAALATLPAPDGIRLRRATQADAPAVRAVYDAWASGQNGPLTRRGVSFPATDEELVEGPTGVTLAVDEDGGVCGYAAWVRGHGDGPPVAVLDLLAGEPAAYQALLRAVGSFGSVAATVRLRTSGDDPLRLFVPSTDWSPVQEDLYMLKVLDVAAALTGMGCAPALRTRLGFTLVADALPELDGAYQVEAADGVVCCRAGAVADDRTLSSRGLSLLCTGAAPCRDLRVLGLLRGGDPAQDADWDALFAGRPRHVRDYF